ncbi:transcriptional regulator [Luteitalea sp. TBR-22]|uniref:PAS domain-containing protein n=1 Tax=Luteitalea sp. TBR-22 TaxID=2802971 RepID=UPI001AF5CC01|nr:PAS domain-containing protein [Luteitalea sp. TBR-22]BCS36010.1 transcriptional regulator [Luteitalea sp. TBR-22]
MAFTRPTPTGHERFFADDDVIVSKTDLTGKITYANDVFLTIASYEEHEVIGQPHSLIRHPDMPRSVFKFMWDTLGAEKEIFAYVVNMARNGDHYWVLAHVTPTFGPDGRPIGYHSNRRVPEPGAVSRIKQIYAALLAEERKYADKRQQLEAGTALLQRTLQDTGMPYEEFVWTLAA